MPAGNCVPGQKGFRFFSSKICHVDRSGDISEYFRNSKRLLDFARNDKELKPFRMPIRILKAALAFVFEEFVNRRQQDTGALWIDPHVKVEFVVHEIDIAASEHGKKFSSDFEVFSVNDPFVDSEIGGRIPGDAVAGARNNQI